MLEKTILKEGEVLLLLQRKRSKAAKVFGVLESDFSGNTVSEFPQSANEPEVKYEKRKVEEMSAAEVMRYLEEKDKRHYEERGRLLAIIENLTKTK